MRAGTVIANVARARRNTVDEARYTNAMDASWQRQVDMQSLRISKLRIRKMKLRRLKQRRLGMKNTMNTRIAKAVASAAMMLALLSSIIVPAFGQTRRKPVIRRRATVRRVVPAVVYHNVAAGEVIRVRLNQTITSETARVGDQFTTTVTEPVYAQGVQVIPAGSVINGRVTSVNRPQRKSKAGTLGVHFVSLRLPAGFARSINGDLTDANEAQVNADNEGGITGHSATKRNVVFIGGGAATGALIGAIAGGGKGAGIGALVGGGLGAAGAVFSKGHEAVVKSGTQFGVVLNQNVSLPATNIQ